MVESAQHEMAYFDEVDFDLMKISVKASNVPLMVEAYRQLSEVTDVPLHLGVTEAGPPPAGLVKATAGIATLLLEGIGDTIRYSLTADPVEEARAGRQLLEALGLRERKNVDLIACPSCGRAEIDVIDVANRAMQAFGDRKIPLQVAVMGCVVNGPGEAREADLGIAAGNKRGHLFVKGRNVAVVPESRDGRGAGRVGRVHPRARHRGGDRPRRHGAGRARGGQGPRQAARRPGRRRQPRRRAHRRDPPDRVATTDRASSMTPHDHPLFEFDPSPEAVINPSIHRPMLGLPAACRDVLVRQRRARSHRRARAGSQRAVRARRPPDLRHRAPRARRRPGQPGRRRAGGRHVAGGGDRRSGRRRSSAAVAQASFAPGSTSAT